MLEDVLFEWIRRAVPEWRLARRRAFAERLGWANSRSFTLQETGARLGITRQSAFEGEQRLLMRLETTPPPATSLLHRVTELAESWVPIRSERIGGRLNEQGLARGEVSVAGIALAARLQRLSVDLTSNGTYLFRTSDGPPPVEDAVTRVSAICRAAGVCSIAVVLADLGWSSRWDPFDLTRDLTESDSAVVIRWPWVSLPPADHPTNRLTRVIRIMLCAADAIDLGEIEAACRRRVRAKRLPFVPPRGVLVQYLDSHPDFTVIGNQVSSSASLEPSAELGDSDLFLLHYLSTSDNGIRTRRELNNAAEQAGISMSALAFALSYSPLVRRVGRARWCLAGSGAEIGAVEPQKAAEAVGAAYEWDERNRLVVRAKLVSAFTDRLPIPRPILPYLGNHQYLLTVPFSEPKSVILGGGALTDLSEAFAALNAGGDETVRLTVDLLTRTCTLALEDGEFRGW